MLMRQILPVLQQQQRRGGEVWVIFAGLCGRWPSCCMPVRETRETCFMIKTDEVCQCSALFPCLFTNVWSRNESVRATAHSDKMQSGACLPISPLICHVQYNDLWQEFCYSLTSRAVVCKRKPYS